jgi:hypothetical protein
VTALERAPHPWDLRWVSLYEHDWLWWGGRWCIFLFGTVSA